MAERVGTFLYFEDAQQFQLLSDAQVGRVMRALVRYAQEGERPQLEDDPLLVMLFGFLAAHDDRERQKYADICEKRRAAGRQGGRPRKEQDGRDAGGEKQMPAGESNCRQEKLQPEPEPVPEPAPEQGPVQAPDSIPVSTPEKNPACGPGPAAGGGCLSPLEKESLSGEKGTVSPADPEKRESLGAYGWVCLSQREHRVLLEEMGREELERCIRYIDEAAQATGNRNRWRDWALMLRRCHREGWAAVGRGNPPEQQREDGRKRLRQDMDWLSQFARENGVEQV